MPKKILLVDDDTDDRTLFAEAISRLDLDIICYSATNGKMALDKLNSNEFDIPDFIFLDVNMPAWNGWYCLSELKKSIRYSEVPVIMYSTSSNELDITKAHALGAVHFFTKPDDFEELQKTLKEILEEIKA